MSTPNPDPSPKERFHKNPEHLKQHSSLLLRDDLQRALDASLLQMQYHYRNAPDQFKALAAHYLISGANEFVTIFKTLAFVPPPAARVDLDNLKSEK